MPVAVLLMFAVRAIADQVSFVKTFPARRSQSKTTANALSDAALDVRRMRRPQLASMTANYLYPFKVPSSRPGWGVITYCNPRLDYAAARSSLLAPRAMRSRTSTTTSVIAKTTNTNTNSTPRGTTVGSGMGFDDGRRCDLSNINPARSNGGWRLDIYPAIDPRSLQVVFIWQHLRHRFMPLGLIDFLLNSMDLTVSKCPCRVPLKGTCRVPAMILAMPVDVH
jgi:hypothetical protein